jgi:hypothetical protein
MVWIILFTGCGNPIAPVKPVFAPTSSNLPPSNATAQQQLTYMQGRCKELMEGCALIEVVGMPGNIPLNRVSVNINVSSGLAGQTNDRGYYVPFRINQDGQYQVTIYLGQNQDEITFQATQDIKIINGQVAFIRFEVPLGQIPSHNLPLTPTPAARLRMIRDTW